MWSEWRWSLTFFDEVDVEDRVSMPDEDEDDVCECFFLLLSLNKKEIREIK